MIVLRKINIQGSNMKNVLYSIIFIIIITQSYCSSLGKINYNFNINAPSYNTTQFDTVITDKTRQVVTSNDTLKINGRVIPLTIWHPKINKSSKEKFPLIIFSHGLLGIRTQSTHITEQLAAYGYIVVSPEFPLTNFWAMSKISLKDVLSQAKDISFVIDKMDEFNVEKNGILENRIDMNKIALIGHSLGGLTSIITSYYKGYKDNRIKALIVYAPLSCFLKSQGFDKANNQIPTLIIGGDNDKITFCDENAKHFYDIISSPKYFIKIDGGTHTGFLGFDANDEIGVYLMNALVTPDKMKKDFVSISDNISGDISGCEKMLNKDSHFNMVLYSKTGNNRIMRDITQKYTVIFLEYYLKSQIEYKKIFNKDWIENINSSN